MIDLSLSLIPLETNPTITEMNFVMDWCGQRRFTDEKKQIR